MVPAKVDRSEVPPLEDGVAAVMPHSLHLCHSFDSSFAMLYPGICSLDHVQQDIILVVEVEIGTDLIAIRIAITVDFRYVDGCDLTSHLALQCQKADSYHEKHLCSLLEFLSENTKHIIY